MTGTQLRIAPVARDAVDGVGAVAALPEENDEAERCAERDEVQDDRFDRERDGAERAGEQQEGDDRDHGEHEWEVAVDGAGEVHVGGGVAADPDSSALMRKRRTQARDRVLPRRRVARARRDDGEEGVAALAGPAELRAEDRPHPGGPLGDRRGLACVGSATVDEDLDREGDPLRDAIALQSVEGVRGGAASAQRRGAGLAGVHLQRREGEGDHDDQAGGAGDPAAADDQPGPALPAARCTWSNRAGRDGDRVPGPTPRG